MTIDWEAAVRDPRRVAALQRTGLVGTGPDDAFDRLLELAMTLIGAPRGCISLVDAENTSALSSAGFPEDTVLAAPNQYSFCKFVVATGRPLVVNDSRSDPRTTNDPAIEAFEAASWAGYAIEDDHGNILGTFCVMDSVPHQWSALDLHVLATLAQAASAEIALRQARAEVAAAHWEIEALRSARVE
jgi:GAF domain-containing protein